MRWRKLGMIYRPDGSMWWARSHAMVPTPIIADERAIRIYLTCQDTKGIGRVGFVDVSAQDPTRLLKVGGAPVLDIGRPGAFDDNGVMATCAVRGPDGEIMLYYVGFELSLRIRYRLLAGLAASRDGVRFVRVRETPILERSPAELFFRGGPHVIRDAERYRMWYVGGSDWLELHGKQMPVYDLRYAESSDGIHWPDRGEVAVPISGADEHGFGRPWIAREGRRWCLYYSVRRKSLGAYRMGYAVSEDGTLWRRRDAELGLDVSEEGWDSQSVCYAAVLSTGGRTWMFYNGNNFGETGFGIAVRES